MASSQDRPLATFAAGCFWSVELAFKRIPGVDHIQVGYTGGQVANPSYAQVCTGQTGHAEAVQFDYDPSVVSYNRLLQAFWDKHDATTLNRQGGDIGTQYRSAIFYHSDEQKQLAEASKQEHQADIGKPVVTEIVPAGKFYPAEETHQAYLEKRGQSARKGCSDPIRCYG
ncbi:hypothetical protein H4R33_004659 [Dimargaris cristalligena]|uniref:peptide-methionine (S)-S-oxide reductase n=1 Tax=Dimargaris cristalligena TaxID=215637 RepID=A0A4P9ZR66_9FUNG|nr:hypothetical protein H4R33_004659 [Dimargaris cristalligena]RKP36006.1 peptide methionine sulfoxide reductase MsrA [Dimargaris cristalligena]|eukprot:RKP36006.1 peptide methionine sulfoxide reductase MsrA [Dimargaris cristalligena]